MSEEVVLASFNQSLIVSNPQSELWLEEPLARQLVAGFRRGDVSPDNSLPAWLKSSVAAGRLLLSDQRTGRWVLLGEDHIADVERRLDLFRPLEAPEVASPPVIQVKGIDIHLQSAFKLARTLRDFANTRQVSGYEDSAPEFKLGIAPSVEGIQVSDSNSRVGLTPREAAKWAGIIEAELARFNAIETVRGKITTVTSDGPGGRFVLQWGDEVFIPYESWGQARRPQDRLIRGNKAELTVVLDRATSACVALGADELSALGSIETVSKVDVLQEMP